MSVPPYKPVETRAKPPFYGPDNRYLPPTENGAALPSQLPGHLELPEENGEFAQSFRELPQSHLLSSSIWPILEQLHPDRHFAVGHDCGINRELTEPLEKGAICPDWFYVPGVPPVLDGHYQPSYGSWASTRRTLGSTNHVRLDRFAGWVMIPQTSWRQGSIWSAQNCSTTY